MDLKAELNYVAKLHYVATGNFSDVTTATSLATTNRKEPMYRQKKSKLVIFRRDKA